MPGCRVITVYARPSFKINTYLGCGAALQCFRSLFTPDFRPHALKLRGTWWQCCHLVAMVRNLVSQCAFFVIAASIRWSIGWCGCRLYNTQLPWLQTSTQQAISRIVLIKGFILKSVKWTQPTGPPFFWAVNAHLLGDLLGDLQRYHCIQTES